MIVVHRLSVLWVFGGVSSRVDVVRFIGRVLLVFVGAFLLLFLAGGQWFIGRVLLVFGGVPLLLFPCRWSMVHRLGGVSLGEMWCGSSVGFYGCVGVAFLLQFLAG